MVTWEHEKHTEYFKHFYTSSLSHRSQGLSSITPAYSAEASKDVETGAHHPVMAFNSSSLESTWQMPWVNAFFILAYQR